MTSQQTADLVLAHWQANRNSAPEDRITALWAACLLPPQLTTQEFEIAQKSVFEEMSK